MACRLRLSDLSVVSDDMKTFTLAFRYSVRLMLFVVGPVDGSFMLCWFCSIDRHLVVLECFFVYV